jgi:transcriptional regulator GlxA family with amidase domain
LEPAEAAQTEALLQQMVQEQALDLPFRTLAMENVLRTLLILLYRTNANRFPSAELSQTARDMLEVQRHLDSHETEPLKLKEVAALFHYDMYHLSRAFHRTTGYGFREYLVRRRVNLAARLLRDTTDNVTQISAACGFNSVPHFIRTFRQILGDTPLQYRKATQKPLSAGSSGQEAPPVAGTLSNNNHPAHPSADTRLNR